MYNVIIATIIKGIPIYLFSLLISRSVGKKIITKMNFFDFVMGVSMGSMIANAVVDKDSPVISEVTALSLFTLLTIGVSYLCTKSFWLRKVVNSQPLIVIENGRIVDSNLKKLRTTINELMMKLREKDIFNLDDVEYAIIERDGKLSVLVKANKKPITPYDLNMEVKNSGLLKDVVIDGNIIDKNLKLAGVDVTWLQNHLKKNNIKDISDVFYAGVDKNKKLTISKRFSDDVHPNDMDGLE